MDTDSGQVFMMESCYWSKNMHSHQFKKAPVSIISKEKNSGRSLSKVSFEIVPVSQKVTLKAE